MSDSDDDVPLMQRATQVKKPAAESDSDDEVPLAKRASAKPASNGTTKPTPKSAPPRKPAPKRRAQLESESEESEEDGDDDDDDEEDEDFEEDEEDVPLAKRKTSANRTPAAKKAPDSSGSKRKREESSSRQSNRTSSNGNKKAKNGESGQVMWETLIHSGVLFPPEYEPHGVKMLYDGKPVDLTPEEEEVATMFAVMKETDYMNKPKFLQNFWNGFKEVLGKNHVIKSLDKCDFTPIYEWAMAEREKKKELTKEEKQAIKAEKDAKEEKYKFALIDGRKEPVGNFRVEPPGLFRGRGEHPKMGMIKKRVYPRDITINISKDAPVPEHPYPGQKWKEIRHDNSVTWLAFWKDTVSPNQYKYVWLAPTSTFKADSDLAKYEKARKLKLYIEDIRKNYQRDWDSSDVRRRQMGVALYFIDKLALRAGHEKDEDEADTVGCCTLKVENIELMPPSSIKFDFLGKDSIRYEDTVEVHPKVYEAVKQFMRMDAKGKKKSGDRDLFDAFDATDLNKELKQLMDGLSVKVFRTYNASVTLDRLLAEMEEDGSISNVLEGKKADYDRANKEVAILCNHQRSIPKAHQNQMEKMTERLNQLEAELQELEDELKLALKGKAKEGKKVQAPDAVKARIAKKKAQIDTFKIRAQAKEDLKTVALGTSKINYMDPRISVAWCKRNEVPIEKVFNKSLLAKFLWAMDVEPSFRF